MKEIHDGFAYDEVGSRFLTLFREAGRRIQEENRQWIAEMRERGVKAGHPDDGWHQREEHYVQLCYPLFNDGVAVGDVIALRSHRGTTALVTITRISQSCGLSRYYYEESIVEAHDA